MKLKKAEHLAKQIIKLLKPACNRIEVAGSIRRQKPEVKDIELVCIPKSYKKRGQTFYSLDLVLDNLDEVFKRIKFIKRGPRMKNFWLIRKDGSEIIQVDLFCVLPPAQWGVIFALRTGPSSFSQWLVSYRKPQDFRFKDGRIQRKIVPIGKGKPKWMTLETAEEEDVFRILKIDFIPIEKREEY